MAPSQRFVNYPVAKEAPASALEFKVEDDKNPTLRGPVIVVLATLIGHSTFLQKLLWTNAGLGKPKLVPGLDKEQWRLDPTVIPLGSGDESSLRTAPEFGPELFQPPPEGLAGRFYSAVDYHNLYKTGQATPLQVIEALIPLIKPPSKYAVAFRFVHEDELLAAAKASTERWAAGKQLGILDGVPFGVKDDIDVEGFVSAVGMEMNTSWPYFNTPADSTVWPVKKLLEAGAILLGKNNMHELGADVTGNNPATGTPTNWFNTTYYPGGSSSGGASGLGAGLFPITVGTDAGGSNRTPAAFNGVYGLKVSHHRTMTMERTAMCVMGPLAATADDLTIAYRVMAQPNRDDPIQGMFAPSVPPDPAGKKYIGLCRTWLSKSDPVVLETFQNAVDYLEKTGYEVVDISLPYLREGQLAHAGTCLTEAAEGAKSRVKNPADYLRPLSYANQPLVGVGGQTPAADYLKYNQLRQIIMQHMAYLFEKYPGLLVLTPTSPLPGWPIHPGDLKYGFMDPNRQIRAMLYVWLANTTGCPAISVPVGYIDPVLGEGRVPVGLMAMGEWGAEEQLLAFAKDTEAYLDSTYPGGRLRPKEWADVFALAKEKTATKIGKDSAAANGENGA